VSYVAKNQLKLANVTTKNARLRQERSAHFAAKDAILPAKNANKIIPFANII